MYCRTKESSSKIAFFSLSFRNPLYSLYFSESVRSLDIEPIVRLSLLRAFEKMLALSVGVNQIAQSRGEKANVPYSELVLATCSATLFGRAGKISRSIE